MTGRAPLVVIGAPYPWNSLSLLKQKSFILPNLQRVVGLKGSAWYLCRLSATCFLFIYFVFDLQVVCDLCSSRGVMVVRFLRHSKSLFGMFNAPHAPVCLKCVLCTENLYEVGTH